MQLLIGPATAAAEAEVVALWRHCGLVAAYNDPVADFRFAEAGPGSEVLVGRGETGELCGAVMVGHDGHRGWLYYVAAASHCRGCGVGRRMVEAAEAWLARRGIRKAQLLVRETNLAVVSFYEHLGYEVAPRAVLGKWIDRPI